jgi:hypothetical protein
MNRNESNTHLSLRQWPESVFPVPKHCFSLFSLYVKSIGNLDAGTLLGLQVFGYAIEFKPFTFLYALDLLAFEFSVNSKNSISGYGLTYDIRGLKTRFRHGRCSVQKRHARNLCAWNT